MSKEIFSSLIAQTLLALVVGVLVAITAHYFVEGARLIGRHCHDFFVLRIPKLVAGKASLFGLRQLEKSISHMPDMDQTYIRNTIEGFKIQIIKSQKDYDELKYLSGADAIEFLQNLSDGKYSAFKKDKGHK